MLSNLLFIFALSTANAEQGEFTLVGKGQPSPFAGVLFNEPAMAHLLAMPDEYKLQCDLDIEYLTDKLNTKHNLEIQKFETDLNFTKEQNKIILNGKEKEIEELRIQLEKRNGINKNWYFAGGVAAGVLFTGGLFALWNKAGG